MRKPAQLSLAIPDPDRPPEIEVPLSEHFDAVAREIESQGRFQLFSFGMDLPRHCWRLRFIHAYHPKARQP